MITTITGTITNPGKTYIHEHLKVDLSGHKKDPDTNFDALDKVIEELTNLKEQGIETVVDVTNRGMGRDIHAMLRVAQETGLNIIASTGFYKDPFLPEYVNQKSDKELIKLLRTDIEVGIDETQSKAHILGEVGTSHNHITPTEERLLQIISRVHHDTGKPILTHTTLGTMALEQLTLLKKCKINLDSVLIGHLDLSNDLEYHLRVADQGCFLGFDTIGKLNYQPDETRVNIITELVKRGHQDQILLSQDLTRKTHLKSNGGIGYGYLYNNFIPKLMEAGLDQGVIDKFLTHNPTNFLNT